MSQGFINPMLKHWVTGKWVLPALAKAEGDLKVDNALRSLDLGALRIAYRNEKC